MHQDDTEAAWQYHNGTKHPDGALMDPRHSFDPRSQPLPLKVYTGLEPIPLPPHGSSRGVPTLAAISSDPSGDSGAGKLDFDVLARVLHYSTGITKKIKYRWGELLFRAAACTGALYHIELYVVCGDLPGLDGGVYHYEPHRMALTRLRRGDYRHILIEATGNEPAMAEAPATLVYTDVFWRNACKYQAREYRHAFWDSGTILSHSLALASAQGLAARVVAGFVDEAVNGLLDIDTRREAAVALLTLGRTPEGTPVSSPGVGRLSLETDPTSDDETEFPAILEMHQASSLAAVADVVRWRSGRLCPISRGPSVGMIHLEPPEPDEVPKDSLERVIVRRGSTRRFSHDAITFAQLSTILDRALGGIAADFCQPPGTALYEPYIIVNDVDGLAPGSYFFHREQRALELLKKGDFRRVAGHLGLDQALPADAAVAIFLMADLGAVLERFGNRGYRVAQLDASIAAGRLYLAAYALPRPVGATGLTFFDDAVTDFFSPHARGKSVMFLLAVGNKASPRQG